MAKSNNLAGQAVEERVPFCGARRKAHRSPTTLEQTAQYVLETVALGLRGFRRLPTTVGRLAQPNVSDDPRRRSSTNETATVQAVEQDAAASSARLASSALSVSAAILRSAAAVSPASKRQYSMNVRRQTVEGFFGRWCVSSMQ